MDIHEKMPPRIIQEFVPGKQITLCHIIANPGEVLYTKLGLDPQADYTRSAIGVLTVIPYESAVIAADIAMKSSGAEIGFVDRFTGTLIITGSVSSVEAAFTAIRDYFVRKLDYICCDVTKT
jgi:ethanolamine utilization protein EutS